MFKIDGDRMYNLLALESHKRGKELFLEDVAEYEDFKEHLNEIDITEDQKEKLYELVLDYGTAIGREAFVRGYKLNSPYVEKRGHFEKAN